ncbi:GNAT family N-acetyltransferase [Nocardioides anomalus]|nr:GNAT family N-acetyltransferase [Nocardioides anomalus]
MRPALPTSSRLTYDEMTEADLDDLARLLGDAGVMAHYPHPFSRDEALGWIRWQQRNYDRDGFGLWLLRDRDGAFVGDGGLTWQVVDGEEHLELGYHLLPAHQGLGLATEAATACRELARARGVDHLIAIIAPGNAASVAVAERVGLTLDRHTVSRHGLPVVVYRAEL